MTQHPSPDRLLRRLPDITGLDPRPDPTYTPTTDTEADGTVLDVIPLPGTDKVLMIVAHVVPAQTVKTTEPMPCPRHAKPGGTEPGGAGTGGAGTGTVGAWREPWEPRSETAVARAGYPTTAQTPTGPPSDGLRVDRPSRRVLVDDREVQLTFQEFELLAHFAAHPWTVFTRAELMRALWPATDPTTRTVDIHVHRLRRKLGRLSTQLTTVRRVGNVYRPHLANRAATPPPSG
jgi:hypothetical protein